MRSIPVGSPVSGSLTIRPAGGSGVSRVMPEMFERLRVDHARRPRLGAAPGGRERSRRARPGSGTGPPPAGSGTRSGRRSTSLSAGALTRSRDVGRDVASDPNDGDRVVLLARRRPERVDVAVVEARAGASCLRRRSRFVAGPASFSISSFVPTATIRSPRIATASAMRSSASTVMTLALRMTRSAGVGGRLAARAREAIRHEKHESA